MKKVSRLYCLPLILLMLFSVKQLHSQEMLGIANSKYSGINGAVINPSFTVASPFYLDVNLVSAGLFFQNNYVYLSKNEYRFRNFLSLNPQLPTHPPDGKFYYDYYTSPDKKGYVNVRAMGPSASMIFGRHSFGFYTDARSVTSARNIPFQLAKFIFEGLTFPPQYDIEFVHNQKMSGASLNFAEVALNYSYVVKNRDMDFWTAGITVKRLLGYAGGYVNLNSLDYMVPDRDTLIVYHATGEGGFSLPVNYQNNQFTSSPLFRGKGMGFDIGITIQQKLRSSNHNFRYSSLCSQLYEPYRYRIGISLLDIGRISFNGNAMKLLVNDGNTFWPGINTTHYASIQQFVDQASIHFFGNPNQLVTDNRISIGLPTALSVQADYNVMVNWFVNGTLFYPVKLYKVSVVRPALIALNPRYETRQFGFGAVMSFYDWSKLHFGINARFRGFYLGTEMLGGFFHMKDFTGIDIYGGLKFSLQKGKCRSKASESCGNNEYVKFQKHNKRKSLKVY